MERWRAAKASDKVKLQTVELDANGNPIPLSRRQPKRVRTRRPTLECLEDRYVPSTLTVTDTYSLRQAILDSNAHPGATGPNTIDFNLPTGMLTINASLGMLMR